ncbi:MAG TPA: bifunctional 4-hydroxy-2-oxoglutarate aldolase/2-dehydro-3-deoxy-phosphogluconate aldolase [Candidatus Acidoferrum sp.]|nr:bifunctional 4-hydroxy-2-oxoglutarate aldolase/2-dehydro-3-deoxy-phosphogluconate aldolase [Candidatus Acidoferrum sp.]
MTPEQALNRIGEVGIVPVVRASSSQHALDAVEAIEAGGIPVVEITMTVPDAVATIREVIARCGDRVLVGAGTVCNAQQARECIEAGAQFLVSPGLSINVLEVARTLGVLAIPGALTPTEVMAAAEAGAKAIKIFPCGSVGGHKYISALRGPFPGLHFIPTGGVNPANAAEFFAAGAFAIGMGSDLVNALALREGRKADVIQVCRAVSDTVLAAKRKSA